MRNKRHWIPALPPLGGPAVAGAGMIIYLFTIFTPAFASVTPGVQTYDGLLHAIRQVRSASEQRIERAVDQEKVREAWEIGKLIDAHILQHKERADYGEKVLERLASDLKGSSTELRYMLRFFRAYPIQPSTAELSWSHYRELLSINDVETRKRITEEASRENWTEKQVRAEVRRQHAGSVSEERELLPVSGPGNLYTYRVVKPAEGPYAGKLALDLGFAVTFRPREFDLSAFKEGDVVTLRNGKLEKVSGSEPLGTYTAYVTEVIDGDTIHARIDLGFGITIHQKLRLRGLDAPPLESSDGRAAKEFLEKHGVRAGAQVLIKTSRPDKYDRYLADVWVDGTFVNQQLIDQGLAVSVPGAGMTKKGE